VAERRTIFFSLIVVGIVAGALGGLLMAASIDSLRDELGTAKGEVAALHTLRTRTEHLQAALDSAERREAELQEKVRQRQTCGKRGFQGTGGPHLWLFPDRGPPGTRVMIVGDCFKGSFAHDPTAGYGIFLLHRFMKPRECELIGPAVPFRLDLHRGRAQGFFTVPFRGLCFQHRYGRRLAPEMYELGVGCHACGIARFRVTPGGVRR
jgi:hypothetical protein